MLKFNSKIIVQTIRLGLFFISILFLSVSASAELDFNTLLRDVQNHRTSPDIEVNVNTKLTALMFAAANNDREGVKILLGMGANPNKKDINGWIALMFASHQKDGLEVVQDLLNHGSDPNTISTDGGQTALIFAASRGYVDIVDALLARGARHDHFNNDNKTALFYASKEGHVTVIDRLLEVRRDNQETKKYISEAIGVARYFNHIECVDILKQYKRTII